MFLGCNLQREGGGSDIIRVKGRKLALRTPSMRRFFSQRLFINFREDVTEAAFSLKMPRPKNKLIFFSVKGKLFTFVPLSSVKNERC